MLSEFRAFVMKGNVIDLAVAVIMGGAFGAVVTSLVKDVFTPMLAAIVGAPDFSSMALQIGDSAILYGSFLNAVISFLLIAFAVFFFLVKPMNMMLERINRAEEVEAKATAEDIELLREIRDLLKAR
ncbi:MAG: large conductance mechanosensitive channel protein MscL [Dehalococcoidia bacterium]|nr:large conductance mechanosensitive channel protein MscL [Dehalococcoidia bacterium]